MHVTGEVHNPSQEMGHYVDRDMKSAQNPELQHIENSGYINNIKNFFFGRKL